MEQEVPAHHLPVASSPGILLELVNDFSLSSSSYGRFMVLLSPFDSPNSSLKIKALTPEYTVRV